MSNEITYHSNADTGSNVYAVLENTIGQLWNGSSFEDPVSGNWATYAILLTEQATSTGIFRANMPAVSAGTYSYTIRVQTGTGTSSVDVTDVVLAGVPLFGWDGSAIVDIATIAADAARLTAARAGALTDWINGGRLDLLLDAIKGVTDVIPDSGALTTIGTDTARLTAVRAAILTDWINGGRLDLILDAILADTANMQPKLGTPLADVSADIAAVKAETALIVADTNELQTDDVPGLIAALNNITAASVWAVDATGQQTQGTFGQAIGDPGATAKSLWQAVVSDAAGVSVAADVITIKTETALIVADTNELQTDDVPGLIAALNDPTAATVADAVWDEAQADHVAVGSFGIIASEIASILVDTAEIGTAGIGLSDLGGMSAGMKAEVNVEALDVLNTDTFAEPGQGTPPATTTLVQKIGYLFKNFRNKKTETNTEFNLYADDAATVDQKATVSDAAGVTTKDEMATGP